MIVNFHVSDLFILARKQRFRAQIGKSLDSSVARVLSGTRNKTDCGGVLRVISGAFLLSDQEFLGCPVRERGAETNGGVRQAIFRQVVGIIADET